MSDPRPRKRFAQHFLQDPFVVARILSHLNLQEDDLILEIGSGTGCLSMPISDYPVRLHAVELDRDLAARLERQIPHMTMHQASILDFDLRRLPPGNIRVIGNLPYNISTEILFHLLRFRDRIQDMLLMLQKEVVDRIVAPAGDPARGRLSVMCQTYCMADKRFDVPPEAFRPPPKVHSSVLELKPRPANRALIPEEPYAELVRQAFSSRRKTLRNALRPLCTAEQIQTAGLDPNTRAQSLEVEDFLRLHQTMHKSCGIVQ